uniref:Uncharacterized protein n=1 Tax=Biomphalaria glabrata TaxID=6526 RepID=A0A2C9KAB5_BIOGL
MFKRKQDVDKHVNAVLSRKRDDKEKSLQGFQIAKLYVDVKEYATARKYLSGFLKVREDVPQAYQLLGDINIALGNKEDALENYKKAISLGGGFVGSNRSLVKKVCELCCELDVDGQMMKFWLEKCELLCPRDEIIYKLKAKVLETVNGHDNVDKENLIASELINQPTNLSLRIKLLNSYMESGKYDEAYDNAVSTDLTTAFIDQLQWFETLSIVFQEYSSKHQDSQSDPGHNEHLLHILRNLSYLSLWKKDIQECVLALTRVDGAKEPTLKSTFVTPLGDKGNIHYTKALDVSGQDEILPASYTPLGGAKEPTLKSTFVTPLGDKGNRHHTKALDVSGQDEILPASYTPLGGAKEPTLKSTFVTPLGDKGNIHLTKALDVSGQDEILPASYTPLGGAKEPTLTSKLVTPLGDKGNRHHTKALDVSGQDEILPASYTPLGGAKEPTLKSTFVTPLGDKGNRHHTKSLDVSGQDEILPASYTPLGGVEQPVASKAPAPSEGVTVVEADEGQGDYG